MSKETIYPEGVKVFSPHAKAPDFVIGVIVITPNELVKWLKANPEFLTEYQGEKQLKLQILSGKKGLYTAVDTYKSVKEDSTNLPF